MSLSKFKPNPTVEIELTHAPGIFVTLASRDSAQVKAAIQKFTDKRLMDMRRGKALNSSNLEAESISTLKAAIVNIEDRSGADEPVMFTPETVDELVGIGPFRRQLDEAMANDALFFES